MGYAVLPLETERHILLCPLCINLSAIALILIIQQLLTILGKKICRLRWTGKYRKETSLRRYPRSKS